MLVNERSTDWFNLFERLLDHEAWLERERVAAEEYSRKRELEEKRKRDKEEREVIFIIAGICIFKRCMVQGPVYLCECCMGDDGHKRTHLN